VKYAYCPACDEISVLSSMEPERCSHCNKTAFPVKVKRTWQYWASASLILTGAIVVFVTDLSQLEFRVLLLLPFVIFGIFFSTWGLHAAKGMALAAGRIERRGKVGKA
jgi:hypothetical protein